MWTWTITPFPLLNVDDKMTGFPEIDLESGLRSWPSVVFPFTALTEKSRQLNSHAHKCHLRISIFRGISWIFKILSEKRI